VALIEPTDRGARFERGAGIAGVLGLVVVVGASLGLTVKVDDALGRIPAGVVAVLCLAGFFYVLHTVLTWPVNYVEVDGVRKRLQLGSKVGGKRVVHTEVPYDDIETLQGFDRGGEGASWTLVLIPKAPNSLPRSLAEGFDGAKVDLMEWTQEEKGTIRELLEHFDRHGCPADVRSA
jgi:hypothetical protein